MSKPAFSPLPVTYSNLAYCGGLKVKPQSKEATGAWVGGQISAVPGVSNHKRSLKCRRFIYKYKSPKQRPKSCGAFLITCHLSACQIPQATTPDITNPNNIVTPIATQSI